MRGQVYKQCRRTNIMSTILLMVVLSARLKLKEKKSTILDEFLWITEDNDNEIKSILDQLTES